MRISDMPLAQYAKQQMARRVVRFLLGRRLTWEPLANPEAGFSIVLGVPWGLRHLLPVNLKFVAKTDLRECRRIHIVFDRIERPEAAEVVERIRHEYPALPLHFQFYPPKVGGVIERFNATTMYHATNTVLAMRECVTKYFIMHDFDLYPLHPDHFACVYRSMRDRALHFSGLEYTYFSDLTEADRVVGTWVLGIDAQWVRSNYQPLDAYPRWTMYKGRRLACDPFTYIELQTDKRALAPELNRDDFCHVNHLCGTYLNAMKGEQPNVLWRLHYLWYLEEVSGHRENMADATRLMREATGPTMTIGPLTSDFSEIHVTCANVLRDEVRRMEEFLFGAVRPHVAEYCEAFRAFLKKFGDNKPVSGWDPQRD